MANFSFRIGTKLGLTAGIGVLLVAGMLANQWLGTESIASSSRLVLVNTANKADAQGAETAMARTRIALRDIGVARTTEQFNAATAEMRESIAGATALLDSAEHRATRAATQEFYRGFKPILER